MTDGTRGLIADRLRARVSELERVEGVVDLTAALQGATPDKSAYVYLFSDAASGDNLDAAGFLQAVDEVYAVVVVTPNKKDKGEPDAADINDQLRREVRQALVGWRPHVDGHMMQYLRGELLFTRNKLFWKAFFVLGNYIIGGDNDA